MDILLRKVARDLTHRKVRAVLTLLGIVVGVAGLVAVSATGRQLAVAQQRALAAPSQSDLIVRTAPLAAAVAPDQIGRRLATALALQPADVTVEVRTVVGGSFSTGGPWRASVLIGLTLDDGMGLQRPELVAGRFPQAGEVVFDLGVGGLESLAIGDLVAFRDVPGAPVIELTTVGFTRTPAALDAAILNQVNAYAHPADVARLADLTGPTQLLVRLPPAADPVAAADRLDHILDRLSIRHGPVEDSAGNGVGARELQTVLWLLFAFSLLGLALSGVLVANTVAATVHDEMGQIGVLKALGAGRVRVAATFVAPALLLGLPATLGGYALGLVAGQQLAGFLAGLLGYSLPPLALTVREAVLAAAIGLGVPLLAAALPALLGSRRPVAELLRTYGLAGPNRRRAGLPRVAQPAGIVRALWRGGHLPLLTLGIANAYRRRLRGGITVLLIAVAVAAALAAEALSASLETTIDQLYAQYAADVWIAFDPLADRPLARAIGNDSGVVAAEVWSRATGFAQGEAIDLWGVPPTTTIYRHRLVAGSWLDSTDRLPLARARAGYPLGGGLGGEGTPVRQAVSTVRLAQRLGLQPGDTLALDVGAETRPVTIVGLVDDESTYLGSTSAGKLFLVPATLASLGGETTLSFLGLALDRHDPAGVEAAIAALEARYAPLHPVAYAAYSDKASTLRTVEVLVVLLRAMVALVTAIGLLGVVNTLAMGVAERRREIGVLRSLGAGRRHLGLLLIVEGLALGGAGYGLGLLLGVPLGRVLVGQMGDVLFGLTFALPPAFLLATLAATLAACAGAGIGPAAVAAGVRPTAVLRYE